MSIYNHYTIYKIINLVNKKVYIGNLIKGRRKTAKGWSVKQ